MKIEINYNSYTYKFDLKTDDISFMDVRAGSQCKQVIRDSINKRLEVWFGNFLEKLGEDFNRPELEIIFTSTQYEINIAEEIISNISKKYNWDITLAKKVIKDKNVLRELHKLTESIVNNKEEGDILFKHFEEKDILSKLNLIDKREVSVVVVAPMSAGKSTLINALIGRDLLPSKNSACTATICKIKDVDGKVGFDTIITDGHGKILDKKENIDSEFISDYNHRGNDEEVEILIEGDIKSIDSSDLKLVLVDTPGPNNSQNERHKEITLNYIKDKKNNPLILYVLDATKLKTNDDKSILTEISDFINNSDSKSKERIIFVLNRIDDFKKNDGDIEEILEDCKEYLRSFEISNPRIFPLSAQLAKLTLLNEVDKLDEEDSEELRYLFNRMKRKDIISYSSLSENEKGILRAESNVNEHTAQLFYSGLPALQIYINEFVNHRYRIEVSNELIHTLKPVLEDLIINHQILYDLSKEDLEKYRVDLEKMTPLNSIEYEVSKKKLCDKIYNISPENKVIDGLTGKVNKRFDEILFKLSDNSAEPKKARTLLAEANRIYQDLMISITTTIKSENDYVFERIKSEIEDMIEVSFKQLIADTKLSERNKNMLNTHIETTIINTEAEIASKKFVYKTGIDVKVSTSRWYNPFSWGTTKVERVFKTEIKVDLKKIYNTSFSPISNDLYLKLNEVKTTYKKEVQDLKKEGLSKISVIENNLSKKIEKEKAIKDQIQISEKLKLEKEKELDKLNSFQKTLEEIIN